MTYKIRATFYDYSINKAIGAGSARILVNGRSIYGEAEFSDPSLEITYDGLPGDGGYRFSNWSCSQGKGGASWTTYSSAVLTLTPHDGEYIELRCQLYENQFGITYNYNNGSGGTATTNYYYGRDPGYNQLRYAPSYSGHYFIGWRMEGKVYAAYSSFKDAPYNRTADAVWGEGSGPTTANHVITLVRNNGTTYTDTQTVRAGVFAYLNASPSYNYHTFKGWLIDGVLYDKYATYEMPNRDVTAVAQWEDTVYELSFNLNGGIAPGLHILTGTASTPITIPSEAPTKSGNNFISWKQSNDLFLRPGEQASITSNTSLTAQFTSASYVTVTFSPNNGTFPSGAETTRQVVPLQQYGKKYGSSSITPFPVPTRSGFDFLGYNTSSSSSGGTEITPQSIVRRGDNHTIYARWKQRRTTTFYAKPNGKCTFDDYPGQTSVALMFTEGLPYGELPSVSHFELPHSLFQGWYTYETSTSGVKYTAETIVPSSSPSLYARWALEFTFDANGGEFPDGTTSKKDYYFFGSDNGKSPYMKFGHLPEAPTATGREFIGWFTYQSSGSEITTETDVPTSAKTYYAHWRDNALIAKFHRGSGYFKDGSGDEVKQKEFEVGSYFSNFPAVGRNGFFDSDFVGWFDGNGNQYREGDYVQKFAIIDLYPKWNGYNIQYYARPYDTCHFDDYPGKNSVTLDYPPNMAIGSVPTVYRDDADREWFDGWYENETWIDATKIDADYVITKSNVYAYARWAQKVTFDANGGQFAGGSTTAVQFYFYGYNSDRTRKTFGSFPTPPTREGITFKGWFTERNGGQQITESSQVEEYAEKTYYAHWSIISVKFIADQSGCSFPDGTKEKVIEFNEGEPYGMLPTLVRTDGASNPFMGWYRNYPETRIRPEDIATVDVYEARSKWELKVTFKANGGTFGGGQEAIVKYFKYGYDDSGTSRYYTYKDCGGFPTPPTRPDYEFLGWYKGNYFHPDDPSYNRITEDENVISYQDEIWAQWKFVGLVALTFDPDGGTFLDGSTQPIEVKAHVGDAITIPGMPFEYPSGKVPLAAWGDKSRNDATGGAWYSDDYGETYDYQYFTANESDVVENKHAPSMRFIPVWQNGVTQMFYDDDGTFLGRSNWQTKYGDAKYQGQGNQFIRVDKPGKQFLKWNPETPTYGTVISSHRKYTAVYEPREVKLTFIGFNNEVLKEVTVKGGQSISPPPPPSIANYSFTGWNPPDFSPAVNTMEVHAIYKGRDCAIRFIAQGKVIYNTTAEYGGYVTDFPPNPEYDDGTLFQSPRGDDPPPAPEKKPKKVFKEWEGADEIVTGDKDLVAVFQDAVPVTDRDFGGDVSDYLFVKPSDDFKNHSPKGDPMPKRVQRADGADKILRWEDPILLDEWASEFIYLYKFIYNNTTEEPNPTDCPHANDRMVKVSRLIGNVYDETTHYSGSESDSIMSGFFRALSDTSSKAAKGGNGGMYNFYKASKLSPLSDTKLIQSGDRGEAEFAKICFGFATDSGGETTDKPGIFCDAGSKSSAEGGYFTKYCLPYMNYSKEMAVFGRKPPPISKNIPLTMYAILQAVSGCVVLCSCYGSETSDSEYERSEWDGEELTDQIDETEDDRDVKPNVGGGGSYGWIDPDLPELKEQYPDDEEWSKIENNVKYYPDTKGTRKPYYKLTKPDGSSEEGTGVMGDGGSSVESTKTTKTGTYVSHLAYMRISEDSRSEWKSTMKSRATGYSFRSDFDYYGEGRWEIENSTDPREQYMPYTTWRRYTVEGEFETCTKFRFKMGSSIVRNHTKSGQPGSHGTFLNPSKFFARVGFSVSWNEKESRTYNSEHSYPLVPDITANGKVVEYDNTKNTALVPFEASLVGYDDTTKQCIWECTDVASIIDAVVDKYKVRKQWDEYAKDGGPGTARGKFMVDVPTPASSGTVLNATSERYSCKGNCSSSADLTITLNLSRIYGAFIWTPWASANLPSVAPSD